MQICNILLSCFLRVSIVQNIGPIDLQCIITSSLSSRRIFWGSYTRRRGGGGFCRGIVATSCVGLYYTCTALVLIMYTSCSRLVLGLYCACTKYVFCLFCACILLVMYMYYSCSMLVLCLYYYTCICLVPGASAGPARPRDLTRTSLDVTTMSSSNPFCLPRH